MKRLALVPTVIGVAAVGAVASFGPADASASPSRHHATETFTIMSVSDPSTSTVVATGRFTAGGTDDSGRHSDHLTFSDGTLTLNHHGKARTSVDPRTCLVSTTGGGRFRVAGGTGAYQHLSGSGHYTFSAQVIFARSSSGACDRDAAPAAFTYLVRARLTS